MYFFFKLKIYIYQNLMEECIICYEDINFNPCLLNCKHTYHHYCIFKWNFYYSDLCPYCRKKIEYKNKNTILILIIIKLLLLFYVFSKSCVFTILFSIILDHIYDNIILYGKLTLTYFILFVFYFILFLSYIILTYSICSVFQLIFQIRRYPIQNFIEYIVYSV